MGFGLFFFFFGGGTGLFTGLFGSSQVTHMVWLCLLGGSAKGIQKMSGIQLKEWDSKQTNLNGLTWRPCRGLRRDRLRGPGGAEATRHGASEGKW